MWSTEFLLATACAASSGHTRSTCSARATGRRSEPTARGTERPRCSGKDHRDARHLLHTGGGFLTQYRVAPNEVAERRIGLPGVPRGRRRLSSPRLFGAPPPGQCPV